MTLCKSCGLEVEWRKENGRLQCFNAGTDTDHWDACSQARTALIQRTGTPFKTEDREGYKTPFKASGEMLMTTHSKWHKGAKYRKDPTCKQCVPPWEVCPHGCPIAL